jgi:peptide deformylase
MTQENTSSAVLETNPIIEWDLSKLRRKSKPVATLAEGMEILHRLVAVSDTFYLEKAAGLAAPQIGIFKRAFIIHIPVPEGGTRTPQHITDKWLGYINPVIHETEGEGEIDYDGCLSFPGMVAITKRWRRIKISAMNCPEPVWLEPGSDVTRENGDVFLGSGASIYFQHEFDHLNGVMFFDREIDEEEKEKLQAEVRSHQPQRASA